MLDKEEGGFRRAENYFQNEEIQVCQSWMHFTKIQLWGHNKRNPNSGIELRFTSNLPCFKILGCLFNLVEKVNPFF